MNPVQEFLLNIQKASRKHCFEQKSVKISLPSLLVNEATCLYLFIIITYYNTYILYIIIKLLKKYSKDMYN